MSAAATGAPRFILMRGGYDENGKRTLDPRPVIRSSKEEAEAVYKAWMGKHKPLDTIIYEIVDGKCEIRGVTFRRTSEDESMPVIGEWKYEQEPERDEDE